MGTCQYPFASVHLTPALMETLGGHPKQINELLRKTIEVTGIKFVKPMHALVKQTVTFRGDVPTQPFIGEIPLITGYSFHNGQLTFRHQNIPCLFSREREMSSFEGQPDQPTSTDLVSSPGLTPNEEVTESSIVTGINKQPSNPVLEAIVYRNCLIIFEMLENGIKKCLSNIDDLSPQNVNRLRKLKGSLGRFINVLDQYQESIKMDQADETDQTELDPVDDAYQTQLVKAKNKLLVIYRELQGSKIKEYLNLELGITIDHVISSILGLDFLVAQHLNNMDPAMRCHQTDLYWIHKYMDNAWESLQNDSGVSPIALPTILQQLGFNNRKAEFLSNRIKESDVAVHKTVLACAKQYIEYMFKYDILLNHKVPNYPYNDTLLNTSYIIPVDQDDDEENEESKLPFNVNGINIGLSDMSDILTDYKEKSKNSEDYKYWFHGTDHKSAQNIIENGIDLERGKAEADFSSGNGFYLASSIDFAYKWSTLMMKKNTCAILVFEIGNPKEFFGRFQGKVYQEPDQDWSNTVRYYRSGKDVKYLSKFRQGSRRFAESLRRLNFIIGPISKDGSNVKQDGWTPRPRQDHPPFEIELCIKEFFMTEAFFRNLHQVIFASKERSSKQLKMMHKSKLVN